MSVLAGLRQQPGEETTLRVAELFGPTVQGEGPSLGQRATFVRLSGCHMSCSYCDTPYTWDKKRFDLAEQSWQMSVAEVVASAVGQDTDTVVITGGEPLLQQGNGMAELAVLLVDAGRRVEVETSATVVPRPELLSAGVRFNCSPKLANSGMSRRQRIRPAALEALQRSRLAVWKFVVTDTAELDEIAELEQAFELGPIWVMPEGTDAATVLARGRQLADPVIGRGWNLTTRLHVLLWGAERGR